MVKLKAEINEYEGKEEAYQIKRQELLSVENQFRNVHDEHIRKIDTGQMSDESYELVIKGFEGQIEDFRKKKRQDNGAIQDVRDKIQSVQQLIALKEEEIEELRIVNSQQHNFRGNKEHEIQQLKHIQHHILLTLEG